MPNKRQIKRRSINRLCWNCNKPLNKVLTFFGWICPHCNKQYNEAHLEMICKN